MLNHLYVRFYVFIDVIYIVIIYVINYIGGIEMNSDELYTLKSMVLENYEQYHDGLRILLESDKGLYKAFGQSPRTKKYLKTENFYLTSKERLTYMMGFIDALAWLTRQGKLRAFFISASLDRIDAGRTASVWKNERGLSHSSVSDQWSPYPPAGRALLRRCANAGNASPRRRER